MAKYSINQPAPSTSSKFRPEAKWYQRSSQVPCRALASFIFCAFEVLRKAVEYATVGHNILLLIPAEEDKFTGNGSRNGVQQIA